MASQAIDTGPQEVSHNQFGQKLGRKGQETRERIIQAMLRLMDDPEGPPVTLTGVAREASMRLTNLYLYFPDIGALLLAALAKVMDRGGEEHEELLRARWPDETLDASAREFVRALYRFWKRHARLLHLRNTLADEGDLRVREYRNIRTQPLLDMLAAQFAPAAGGPVPEAGMMAAVLFTGLERIVTLTSSPHFDQIVLKPAGRGLDLHVEAMLEAEAELLALAVAAQRRKFTA